MQEWEDSEEAPSAKSTTVSTVSALSSAGHADRGDARGRQDDDDDDDDDEMPRASPLYVLCVNGDWIGSKFQGPDFAERSAEVGLRVRPKGRNGAGAMV